MSIKGSSTRSRIILSRLTQLGVFVAAIYLVSVSAAHAGHKVVVVPLLGDDAERPAQVVVVAKSGGDFTDPVAAVNSITDAAESKPYVVYIAPGIYNVSTTLLMKPHVNIVGSGSNATKLVGARGAATPSVQGAIVAGASNAQLSELSIENTGLGSVSLGLYNAGVSLTVKGVRINVLSGLSEGHALYNTGGANIEASNSLFKTRLGSSSSNLVSGVTSVSSNGSYRNVTMVADGFSESVPSASSALTAAAVFHNGSVSISGSLLSALDGATVRSLYTSGSSYTVVKNHTQLFSPGTSITAIGTSKIILNNADFPDTAGVSKSVGASVICLYTTVNADTPLDANCN